MTREMTTIDADLDLIVQRYEASGRIAAAMSQATLLPEHLRTRKVDGKIVTLEKEEIQANCMLIVNQALRWKIDPFALMPCTYVVAGKLAYEGKVVHAMINRLAGLEKRLAADFEGSGEAMTCTMSGTIKGEDEARTTSWSVAEGKQLGKDKNGKPNMMWTTDPRMKLIYSTAIHWAKEHCPEVLLGITEDDEAPEFIDAMVTTPRMQAIESGSTVTADKNPSDPITSEQIIDGYTTRIADCVTLESIDELGHKINAELSLSEEERLTLRSKAVTRRKILSTTTTEADAATIVGQYTAAIINEAEPLVDLAVMISDDDRLPKDDKERLLAEIKDMQSA